MHSFQMHCSDSSVLFHLGSYIAFFENKFLLLVVADTSDAEQDELSIRYD